MSLIPTKESIIGTFMNQRRAVDDFLQLQSSTGAAIFGWIDSDGHLQGSLKFGLSTSPGAPSGSVQFNNGGVFGGSSNFTFDPVTNKLLVEASAIPLTSIVTATFFGNTPNAFGPGVDGGPVEIISGAANPAMLVFTNSASVGNTGSSRAIFGAIYQQPSGSLSLGQTFPDGHAGALSFLADGTMEVGTDYANGNIAEFYTNATGGAGFRSSADGQSFTIGQIGADIDLTFIGKTSGSTQIGVTAVAGTPNRINLPTTTGTSGQVLTTNGANPQQTSWATPVGTIGGSIASTQVAFGSGANTITGSANFTYVNNVLGLISQNLGPTNVTGAVLALSNTSGTVPSYIVKSSDDSITIRNGSQLIASLGLVKLGPNGDVLLTATDSMLTIHGNSSGIYGQGAAVFTLFATGGGEHSFAVANTTNNGRWNFDIVANQTNWFGTTSGSAGIGVAAAAGTPNSILLPTTTGTNGQVLTTNGANPQQTSWTTVGTTTTIASGTATLGTTLIASGAKATLVTVSAPGTLTTDTIMADFNADPTSTTGYTPSANGMLTIVKYPTSGNVNFYVINNTAASITPGSVVLNWRVVR